MLAIITKVSEDFWYEFKEVNSIKDLLEIYDDVIVHANPYDESNLEIWEGFKEEDIPKLKKAEIEVVIYDAWIE